MTRSGDGQARPPGATSHYFDADPEVPSNRATVRLQLPGLELSLLTDRGVFSRLEVDRGTRLLLETAPAPPPAGEVLDLGCGYGAIAIALAHRSSTCRIWAVDVNRRALELTRSNARRTGVDNLVAALPEEVPAQLRLAAIYSNPPVRIGRDPLRQLLELWLARLVPEGRAHLVVHRHLGADSLARWLAERGHPVERVRSRTGYRILSVGGSRLQAPPPERA